MKLIKSRGSDKQRKRKRKTRTGNVVKTGIKEYIASKQIKHGRVTPKAKNEHLPISQGLRKRLSRKCDIYQHNSQEHINNLRIIDYYIENEPKLLNVIKEYRFKEYAQTTKGIIVSLVKLAEDDFDNVNLRTFDPYLYVTVKILMQHNAVRRFIIIMNNDTIVDEILDCKKSCYYPVENSPV